MHTLILFCSLLLSFADDTNVVFVKGQVTVKNEAVKKNQILKDGTTIKTGKDSLVVLKSKHSQMKIGSHSEFIIKKTSDKKTDLELTTGEVFVHYLSDQIKKEAKSKEEIPLRLKVRTATMGVRGTQFYAATGTQNKDDVWMCVSEGIVVIKGKNEKKLTPVKKGEGVLVKEGEKTSKPKPLPWTKKLNWNFDPESELTNKVNIEEAYYDILNQDYD